jgi:PAS domain S-box-containing protein
VAGPDEPSDPLGELRSLLGAASFDAILDGLAEAVTIRDPNHQILYANRAAVRSMGFASLAELRSRPPQDIFADYVVLDERGRPLTMDDVPSVRLLAGQSAEPLVMWITHRGSGQQRWHLLKSAPLHDVSGARVAAVTIIEDITREKQAELRERFLADDRGARQQVAVAHRDPAKADLAAELERLRPRQVEPDRGIGQVVRTGESVLSQVTAEMLAAAPLDPEYRRLLGAVGMRSVLICPLRARGRTMGTMTLVNAESFRRFDERDRAFAEQLAVRAAVAFDNARLATERREIARTLQRSLLPDALPAIEGWSVAAMYRPGGAAEETEVGGDFYDFFRTDGGWVVLLGDVTGKGMEAAAMTALVRHGARFLARQLPDPGAIFAEIDEALRERGSLSLCTAVCARLQSDHAVIGVAGHPPPLVLRDDGRVRELRIPGAILGAWSGTTWTPRKVPLRTDETLIFYTDGVTDTPGRGGRFGLGRFRRFLVNQAGVAPGALVAALDEELGRFRADGPDDDIAVLTLRRSAVRAPPEAGNEAADTVGP